MKTSFMAINIREIKKQLQKMYRARRNKSNCEMRRESIELKWIKNLRREGDCLERVTRCFLGDIKIAECVLPTYCKFTSFHYLSSQPFKVQKQNSNHIQKLNANWTQSRSHTMKILRHKLLEVVEKFLRITMREREQQRKFQFLYANALA